MAQPVAGLQESLVHGLPSSQLAATPGTQVPPAQASPMVHALPSVQASVVWACTQPAAGSHVSAVHGLPSSQFAPEPAMHAPFTQLSPNVQALPSEQPDANG